VKLLKSLGWPVAAGLLAALLILQQQHYQDKLDAATTIASTDTKATNSWAGAVAAATPSVVNIYTSRVVTRPYHPLLDDPLFKRFFNRSPRTQRERIQRSLGSGVIMSADGFILTNNHVISGASEILVLLADGREAIASVIGTDADTDLAVLKVNLPGLTPIPVADPDRAEVGDIVLAIGNPYGFGQSVSQGIISATGRHGLQLNTYENYIQTDAAINPGNSGGALVDANGNLLGINTAIYSQSGGSQGIGLAIPADYASKVLADIVRSGMVVRGWLGVEAQPIPAVVETANGPLRGLVISDVVRNGPAWSAGLRPGDVMTALGGEPTSGGYNAMYRISMTSPGETVTMEVYRGSERLELSATVGHRPAPIDT